MPGIAAGMIRRKSSTGRPGHSPRCTSQPAKSANTAGKAAATVLKTSVFWRAWPFVPVVTNSKFLVVNVKLTGNATVRAPTTSEPYTTTMIDERARHPTKHAQLRAGGTGGRGMDDARPETVTKDRPPSRRIFATYRPSASRRRIVLT